MVNVRVESFGRVRNFKTDSPDDGIWMAEILANSKTFSDGNVQVYQGMRILRTIAKLQGEISYYEDIYARPPELGTLK